MTIPKAPDIRNKRKSHSLPGPEPVDEPKKTSQIGQLKANVKADTREFDQALKKARPEPKPQPNPENEGLIDGFVIKIFEDRFIIRGRFINSSKFFADPKSHKELIQALSALADGKMATAGKILMDLQSRELSADDYYSRYD